VQVDLQLVFNYFSTYAYMIGGGPSKNITILVKELQELCLLLWTHFSADRDGFIRYPGVECYSLEITFGLHCDFEFCRSLLLGWRLYMLMLLCVFPCEMHVFVAQGEATHGVSGFLLTAKYYYYAEGGWDLEVQVP
jgi:hypothetical protein